MKDESRTVKSLRNIIFGMTGQLFGIVLGFVSRTVFIKVLGAEYLGISGLFTNVLSLLSLAELGVGSAITYSLYKPLAEKNEDSIKALMEFYAVIYRIIGCTVAILGLLLLPFLDHIIKDKPNIPHLTTIYLMYLASSVVSYFFVYKSSIIIADQNRYITIAYEYGFNLVQLVMQTILLVVTKNFLLYLAIQVVCSFLKNFFISRKADIMYPYLRTRGEVHLDKETRTGIFKNIGAMISHKVGAVVVFSTDNILISMFVGVYWIGIYSNYTMIMGILNSFLSQIFSSISASIGHLNAKETNEKAYSIFNTAFLMNFWLYGFCAISLWLLLNPFIVMWIGNQYIMSQQIVLIIVANFFMTGMRRTVLTFRDTMGLFWNDRYKPLFESAINLIVSLYLVIKLGIAGVLLGTLISTITTSFWVEAYILYKYGFNQPVRTYFAKYAIFSVIAIMAALITDLACSIFTAYTLVSFLGRLIVCLIIPNVIFMLLFFRTREFKYVFGIMKGMVCGWLPYIKRLRFDNT